MSELTGGHGLTGRANLTLEMAHVNTPISWQFCSDFCPMTHEYMLTSQHGSLYQYMWEVCFLAEVLVFGNSGD